MWITVWISLANLWKTGLNGAKPVEI